MRVENLFACFAKVKPANHTNSPYLCLTKHLAKSILSSREMRTAIVKRHVGGIVRDDSAHSKEQNIGLEFGQLCCEAGRVKSGVGFAQVRLHEPNRLAHPPALLGITRATSQC